MFCFFVCFFSLDTMSGYNFRARNVRLQARLQDSDYDSESDLEGKHPCTAINLVSDSEESEDRDASPSDSDSSDSEVNLPIDMFPGQPVLPPLQSISEIQGAQIVDDMKNINANFVFMAQLQNEKECEFMGSALGNLVELTSGRRSSSAGHDTAR